MDNKDDFKVIRCGHKGCNKSNLNASIFTVGKGHFCAHHFTGARTETKAKELKK